MLSAGSGARLKLDGLQASVLGNARKHFGADLFAIVKGENEIRPTFPSKCAVGAGLSLDAPPNA